MATRNVVCKKVVREDFSGIDFNFTDGRSLAFLLTKATDATVRDRAMLHGFSQKIGDTYAGSGGDLDEAYESAASMIEQIYGGEWSAEREPAGPRPSMVADAVIAVATAAGLTFDEAVTRAKYIGKDAAEARKKALSRPDVKAAFDKIRADAAAARAAESAKAAGATAPVDVASLI